jgi:uncharacterized protein with HEPN domain
MNRKVRLNDYLNHIISAIEKIEEYTVEGKENFYSSSLIQDAVMRNFEIVGEASTKIKKNYPEIISSNPDIPFRSATEMRNVLSHEYFNIDVDILWVAISRDIPKLKEQVQSLLKEISGETK